MNGISRHTNKFNLCTAHQIRHRIYHSIMLPVILCACICACAVSTTRYFVYSRAFGKRLVQRTRFNQVKKINWKKYLLSLIQAQFFPFKFDFHLFPCVLFFFVYYAIAVDDDGGNDELTARNTYIYPALLGDSLIANINLWYFSDNFSS